MDKIDAMLAAMAADVVIGGAREARQPNGGVVGRKRQARKLAGEAA